MTENPKILLVGINSTYQHTSLGLRYLLANMKKLKHLTEILEFTIQKNCYDIVEGILQKNPTIVGFGIYIWNIELCLEVVRSLKKIAPSIKIVIGGPEVSYEYETQEIFKYTDHLICGEADFQFYELCQQILNPSSSSSPQKVYSSQLPEIKDIQFPYSLYSDEDIKNRTIYVEASRGCPYKCEYCLSSLDKSVRSFDLNFFLKEIQILIDRGARQFKFIDRTFNLSPTFCTQILNFFLLHKDKNLFLHFEMVPDRLPKEIKPLIEQFAPGQVQFEVGIQTLNPQTAANVSRKNDLIKVQENFEYLRTQTGVHTHADLIVGLPGENIESFGLGFDKLLSYGPDEIQVGILKRLKGTPIARHELNFEMIYSDKAPFQILKTKDVSFLEMQTMSRFSKYWDLYNNSGNFKNFMLTFKSLSQKNSGSFFHEFYHFVVFLQARFDKSYGISLDSLFHAAVTYLKDQRSYSHLDACEILQKDYLTAQRTYIPHFLRIEGLDPLKEKKKTEVTQKNLPQRQQKHL